MSRTTAGITISGTTFCLPENSGKERKFPGILFADFRQLARLWGGFFHKGVDGAGNPDDDGRENQPPQEAGAKSRYEKPDEGDNKVPFVKLPQSGNDEAEDGGKK